MASLRAHGGCAIHTLRPGSEIKLSRPKPKIGQTVQNIERALSPFMMRLFPRRLTWAPGTAFAKAPGRCAVGSEYYRHGEEWRARHRNRVETSWQIRKIQEGSLTPLDTDRDLAQGV